MKPLSLSDMPYLALSLPESVLCHRYAGNYQKEREVIRELLSRPLPDALTRRLLLELRMIDGMEENYTLSYEDALKAVQAECPSFTEDGLDRLMADGRADWRLREGKPYFLSSFPASTHVSCPELYGGIQTSEDPYMQKMVSRGSLTLRHRIRHTVFPAEGCVRDGEHILVHIPYPLETPGQSRITLLSSSPDGTISSGPSRTVSFSAEYHQGLSFFVEYSFDATQRYFPLLPEEVTSEQPRDFTDEQLPHIRFTPTLRALAAEILGDEKNPLLKARRIYDYITKNITYSYMREYLLIDNIPEFAALNFRGDCGVQALLFITLCRIAGIGARWQSGMSLHPQSIGSHDWAKFYIAPYGWLWADLSAGGSAWQQGNLPLWDFFFGHVTPMRLAANDAFQCELDPPKTFLRADPYDNQSGEIETASRPLTDSEIVFEREMLSVTEISES